MTCITDWCSSLGSTPMLIWALAPNPSHGLRTKLFHCISAAMETMEKLSSPPSRDWQQWHPQRYCGHHRTLFSLCLYHVLQLIPGCFPFLSSLWDPFPPTQCCHCCLLTRLPACQVGLLAPRGPSTDTFSEG